MYVQENMILKLISYCKNNDSHLIKYEEKIMFQKKIYEATIASNKDNIVKKINWIANKNEWQYHEDIENKILKEETIKIYKNVLNDNITFPPRFWVGNIGGKRAGICVRYLCENILELEKESIPKKLTLSVITKYKLSGLLRARFNTSIYALVKESYEKDFHPWNFKRPPKYFWSGLENRVEAFEWYLEQNKNNFGKNNKVLTRESMYEYNLSGLINYYNGSIYKMIEELEPEIKKRKKQ